MAQKVITQLVDDLDGKELKPGEGETVTFALDGKEYELDLSSKNADKFRGIFQEYIAAGRKVTGGSKRGRKASGPKSNAAEIRAWAESNGIDVPARGRMPQAVVDQYNSATG